MDDSLLYELLATVNDTPHGGKSAVIENEARKMGRSPGQVRRRLQRLRGAQRMRPKAARVCDEKIRQIEAVRRRCSDEANGRQLPAPLVIEKAVQRGIVEPGELSAGQFVRRASGRASGMRRHGRISYITSTVPDRSTSGSSTRRTATSSSSGGPRKRASRIGPRDGLAFGFTRSSTTTAA